MIYLVIGTQNSGKSELAEKLSLETGDSNRFYIATMKIYDEAGLQRVEKHRKMRDGKGFITIEQEYNITEVLKLIDNPKEATVLIECISNLVGNEMYENKDNKDLKEQKSEFVNSVAEDIKVVADSVNNTIIVTNEYESNAKGYDDETRLYVQLLNNVNEEIIKFSDKIFDLR
ncbi:MAG: bifunctional adenosylcobinamide kinase/adenosylcobinamide-phosphate guanylyltransferase [Eubacterium sp.]|nr:bifunctional adenosylcobinamide kinase/adenosylcobinamide-phosphate guanylyltransferase [Eubacterium sp.]